MAFISNCEYDIFISYAHVDNLAMPGQADGWIEQFYKHLNLMLAKRFGRMDSVKIWWDQKRLEGSMLFDHSIEEGIKKSAIMICLHSPGYIQSDYCLKELRLFHEKIQNDSIGPSVGDRSRIVHVLLNNMPYTEWPKELGGTSGFPFHEAIEPDDFGDTVDTLSMAFREQMQHVRNSIWEILNDIQKLSSGKELPAQEQKDEEVFTIYLGEVADTLRRPRSRIISELEKKGYKVLTGIPPPDEADAHEREARAAIAKADLSIHLLDEYPGKEIFGEPDLWYPQKQVEIALQSDISQMVWVSPEIIYDDIDESLFKDFLTGLETGKPAKKDYEFIRCPKSNLAQEIVDLAEEIKMRKVKVILNEERLSVLLDTHFNDQLYALDLCKTMVEHQVQPYINVQDDASRNNLSQLGERLSQVKKLVFMYGAVSKGWVMERVSAALQLIITNNYPIEDFFIFLAPPHKEIMDLNFKQRFLKINVFDGSQTDNFDKEAVTKFLDDLKTSA